MTNAKPKATRGGRRPNAGRKPVLTVEEQLAFVIRVVNNLIPAWQGVSSKDYVALIPKEAKAVPEHEAASSRNSIENWHMICGLDKVVYALILL